MATKAQIEANRRNAARSTGPKSAEGKRIVSMNAVRHGLLSVEGLLTDEHPYEFVVFHDRWWRELAPEGIVETTISEGIIWSAWRLQRSRRMEAGLHIWHISECMDKYEIIDYRAHLIDATTRMHAAEIESAGDRRSEVEAAAEDMASRRLARGALAWAWSVGAERIEGYEARIERRLRRQLEGLRAHQASRRAAAAKQAAVEPIAVKRRPDCSGPDGTSPSLDKAA